MSRNHGRKKTVYEARFVVAVALEMDENGLPACNGPENVKAVLKESDCAAFFAELSNMADDDETIRDNYDYHEQSGVLMLKYMEEHFPGAVELLFFRMLGLEAGLSFGLHRDIFPEMKKQFRDESIAQEIARFNANTKDLAKTFGGLIKHRDTLAKERVEFLAQAVKTYWQLKADGLKPTRVNLAFAMNTTEKTLDREIRANGYDSWHDFIKMLVDKKTTPT